MLDSHRNYLMNRFFFQSSNSLVSLKGNIYGFSFKIFSHSHIHYEASTCSVLFCIGNSQGFSIGNNIHHQG